VLRWSCRCSCSRRHCRRKRQNDRSQFPFDILTLEGPGSSIGVSIRDLNADDAARAKVQPSEGVLIDNVREGTPAAKAGLKAGDVVVEFDGSTCAAPGTSRVSSVKRRLDAA
jgi:C-terminal processing protease CtpA/Prc